jgi:hypothetical protein
MKSAANRSIANAIVHEFSWGILGGHVRLSLSFDTRKWTRMPVLVQPTHQHHRNSMGGESGEWNQPDEGEAIFSANTIVEPKMTVANRTMGERHT